MFLNILLRILIFTVGSVASVLHRVAFRFKQTSSFAFFLISRQYPDYLKSGNAMSFCCYHAEIYCKGKGLDIGPAKWSFLNARGIENTDEENAEKILEKDSSQDFIFSSHCLEHVKNWQHALDEWTRVLRTDGILYLYLPHPACRMWQPDVLPFHKHIFDPNTIEDQLLKRHYEILDISRFPDSCFSFYAVARKRKL